MLDPEESLEFLGLEDHLTAVVLQPKLVAARDSFALWCCGGNTVITWGKGEGKGKSKAQKRNKGKGFGKLFDDDQLFLYGHDIQDSLNGVQDVKASQSAFAAIQADGSIVTWGLKHTGGDSSQVQDRLRSVQQIQGTISAFAAILADGSVVAWGDPICGGNTADVDGLFDVQQLQATWGAFAAIKTDGSVVTWGHPLAGGDSSTVQHQLKNVQQVQATRGAPPPASCTSTCSAPPGPCADKSTGCEGEENLQGILWPPASRRARRPRALC